MIELVAFYGTGVIMKGVENVGYKKYNIQINKI